MSQSGASTSRADFGLKPSYSQMTVKDMYNITKGGVAEWGIEGYSVPKYIAPYTTSEVSVGKSKRTFLEDIKKRAGEPDPRKYQLEAKDDFKRMWLGPQGGF